MKSNGIRLHLYTISEITEALRQLSKHQDSIGKLLSVGDFRSRFESKVAEIRSTYDYTIDTLSERLITIDYNGEDVYILDDIQGALTKDHFARFMKFLRKQGIAVSTADTTYIPVELVKRFMKDASAPVVAKPVDEEEPEFEDEDSIFKFS